MQRYCEYHNQPFILTNNKLSICQTCIGEQFGTKDMVFVQDDNQIIQKQKENIQADIKKMIEKVKSLQDQMYIIKTTATTFLEKILHNIQAHCYNLQEKQKSIDNVSNDMQTLDEAQKNYKSRCLEVFSLVEKILQELQQKINLNDILQSLQENRIEIINQNDYLKSSEIKTEVLQSQKGQSQQKLNTDQLMIFKRENKMRNMSQVVESIEEDFDDIDINLFASQRSKKQQFKSNTQDIQTRNEFFQGIVDQFEIINEDQNTTTQTILFEENYQKKIELQYEKLNEFTIQDRIDNQTFQFNANQTLLFMGSYQKIKVFGFDNGQIKQLIQTLNYHTDQINCLLYMKRFNFLFSGSTDKQIVVWAINKKQEWQPYQILKGHQELVLCIAMNQQENILISGSGDKTIRIWKEYYQKWKLCKNFPEWYAEQIIKTSFMIYSLSVNRSQTRIIACGMGDSILVYEQEYGKLWKNIQNIEVIESGYRCCFTFDDQFAFQSRQSKYLDFYDFDHEKRTFQKSHSIQLKSNSDSVPYLPGQFINKLGILMIKHGNCVNILASQENKKFFLNQQIEYNSYYIYGCLSHNGQYLVTQDMESKQIQIRKLGNF